MEWSNVFLGMYDNRPVDLILLEAVAFIFGLWSVHLARREHIGVYPTGLLATTITVYLFWTDRLIGDMLMNAYYSMMSIYGWWQWSRMEAGKRLVRISRMSVKQYYIAFALILLTMLLTYIVYTFFNVTLDWTNYIDIFTSGLFFTAMWLMAIKKIENWTLWIIADIITVPLYAYRSWGMLSLQYLIFTYMAVMAYREWKTSLDN